MESKTKPEEKEKTTVKRTRKKAVPDKIGGYKPVQKIGEGAMGEIWLCEDPSLSRKVVVKQMQASLTGYEDLIQRFQREAILLAHLNHPNIVHAYSVWQERNGRLSLAMEFVHGKNLREILDICARPPVWVVCYILHEILQALVCAHKHQIIHRDLKPSNMMVEKNGKIRLLDFGIARNAGAGQEMTLPGSVLGTAAYMSPEQISAQPVTPLSDLFSLGIIASEMLLGKNPFRGETIEQTSQFILNVKLSPKHFPADVHKPLRHFVCKMLEKKPQNRFKDAQAAADALADLMVDFPRQLDLPLAQWLRATCAQVPYTDVIQQNYSRKKWIIFGLGALAPTLLFVLIFVIRGLFS